MSQGLYERTTPQATGDEKNGDYVE